jgi:hemerythrin superfamily protein
MRSLADQTEQELGGRWSVLTRQRADHARLDRLLSRLPGTSGDEEQALVERICRLVFSHAFAEEAVLWPALRRALPDGDELTARVELEHQQVTELVAALDQTRPGDPDRTDLLERTVGVLRQDVRDEEDVLLPRLQEATGPAQLHRLGLLWELVRHTAPTRAHPIVSRRPPGNHLAALPLSVLDRARDQLDRAGRRAGPARSTLAGMSRTLGRAAAVVETAPWLRRGERAATRYPPAPGP